MRIEMMGWFPLITIVSTGDTQASSYLSGKFLKLFVDVIIAQQLIIAETCAIYRASFWLVCFYF